MKHVFLIAIAVLIMIPLVSENAFAVICVSGSTSECRDEINRAKTFELPLVIWTDTDSYLKNNPITLQGNINNLNPNFDITIVIRNLDSGNIIELRQIPPGEAFLEVFSTKGWDFGNYIISVQHGQQTDRGDAVEFSIVSSLDGEHYVDDGNNYPPGYFDDYYTDDDEEIVEETDDVFTNPLEICLDEDACIVGSITNAIVEEINVKQETNSLEFIVAPLQSGSITLTIPEHVLSQIFMVEVDEGVAEYSRSGDEITILFGESARSIELTGTFVIPEFGHVALLVLVVSITTIIVVLGRSNQISLVNKI